MGSDSLLHHLENGFRLLRKNGIKTFTDPAGSFSQYVKLAEYANTCSLLESLDFSLVDLEKNRQIMSSFSKMDQVQIDTIDWFVPYFKHAYAGIHTILRFADYFHSKKGVSNRFIFYGNPAGSEVDIKNKISAFFPNLLSEKIIILKNHNLDMVPEADVCISTLWTSAYPVLKFNRTKGKFYFIQDYEPLSYPAGTLYALAEATYRFGFYGIVNTPGLHEIFVRDHGGIAEYFIPPVETTIFFPSDRVFSKPSAINPFTIFFYARPDRQHNAFELGISALQRIKRKYGEKVRIYTAGTRWNLTSHDFEKNFIDLGTLPFRETASLYRKCDLGIVFSLSKHPSYIPSELMACGCPVLANYNPATTWLLKDGLNCTLAQPSVSCICEKIEILMSTTDLRRQIASNALDSLPKTCWDDEIEKIYRFMCKPQSK